jgi:aminoglycoside phosphotransferase (APT) family kinase protein
MSGVAGSPLPDLACCFLPVDPSRTGVVVEAGERWSFDPTVLSSGAGAVVWVHGADRSPFPGAAQRAAARTAALRSLGRHLPPGWRVAGIHALPPRQVRAGGLRARLAAAVRAGAVVELTSGPPGGRVLDAVAAAAGAGAAPRRVHFGAGGALVARVTLGDGTAAVLRAGRAGTAADPAPLAVTLRHLAAAGVACVPVPLAEGTTAGVSWLAESRLPGRPPRRLTAALARQVAEACGSFPATGRPPTALADDLAGVADRLPGRAAAVSSLAEHIETATGAWPGVLRHGDLWLGNLLVERGRLTGVLDWDGAHPAAVLGTDLVHLVATDALVRRGVPFGATFLDRPWLSGEFRRLSAPYWAARGVRPDAGLLELAGIAWWAAAIHGTLTRFPVRATDRRWLAANVDSVLHALSGRSAGRRR